MKLKLATVALAACLPSLAVAQESTNPQMPTPSTAPANPSTASPSTTAPTMTAPSTTVPTTTAMPAPSGTATGGIKMADTNTAKVSFITVQPVDTVTSKMIGLNVYNNQNESVGEIEDFVILDGKTIHAVIVGVGGFLGIGERYVAVSPESVVLSRKDNTLRALINTSKDELKNAAPYEYKKRS